MRKPFPELVEAGRIREGHYGSLPGEPHGAFRLECPHTPEDNDGSIELLTVLANNAWRGSAWWEHVSVSHSSRTPSWEEMAWVKDQFWGEDEVVVQFHPAKRDYVNCHPYCLHMWRPTRHKDKLPLPPAILVGPRGEGRT